MTDESSSGSIEAIPNSDPEDESNRPNGHLCEHVPEFNSSVAMEQRVFKLRRGPPSKFQGEAVVASTYGEAASVLRLRKKLRLRLRRKKQQQQQQPQHQSPAETTQLIRKPTQTETLTSLTPTTETLPTPMETPAETHETSSPSPTRMSKTASPLPLPPPSSPPASFSPRLSLCTGTMTTAKNIHIDPTLTTIPAVVHACEGCARIQGDSNCTMQSMTNDTLQPDTNCSFYDKDRRQFNIELCQSSANHCQSAVNQRQSTSYQCHSTSDQCQPTSNQCQSTFDQCQSTSDQSQSTFDQSQSNFGQCWQSIANRHQPTVTSGDEGQESKDCETHWVCLPVGDADKACPMTSLSKIPQATNVAVTRAVKIPIWNPLSAQMPAAHVWSRIRTEDSSSESSSCVSSSTCSTIDDTKSGEEDRYEDIQALRAAAVALFAAQKQLEECGDNGNNGSCGSSSSGSSSSSSRIDCLDRYIESTQDYTDDAVGNSEMSSYQDGISCNDNDDGGFSVVDNGDPYCSSDMGYASNSRNDDHKLWNASQRMIFF